MAKVMIHSNAPWTGSGYGVQTYLLIQALTDLGHEVIVSAYWGLQGQKLNTGEAVILPKGVDAWGNDTLPFYYEIYKPNAVLLLMDIWVMQNEMLAKVPVASWCPVDHKPLPPATLNGLTHCKWAIAMSKFGEQEMRKAGLDPLYMPHMVDTETYVPLDAQRREIIRKKRGLGEETFYVVFNAANKGWPPRKSFDRVLKAWSEFVRRHPNSVLYMHTFPFEALGGMNLIQIAQFYGIPEQNLQLPDIQRYTVGDYSWESLRDMYNAADLTILPSAGEGFGIPVIEAQASGCPVVVTDFSAQSELVGPGYAIPIDDFDDLMITPQMSEQALVRPSEILKALEWGLEQQGNQALRQKSREFIMGRYDLPTVRDKYLASLVETIYEEPN